MRFLIVSMCVIGLLLVIFSGCVQNSVKNLTPQNLNYTATLVQPPIPAGFIEPLENRTLNKVSINDTDYVFDAACRYSNEPMTGGNSPPPRVLSLLFNKKNCTDNWCVLTFSAVDPTNNENMFTVGTHPSTQSGVNYISNDLQSSTYRLTLTPEEMTWVWENVSGAGNNFSGYGYISINKKIDVKEKMCSGKIWIGGRYVYPSDPDFGKYCLIDPSYYPAQKIYFNCSQ